MKLSREQARQRRGARQPDRDPERGQRGAGIDVARCGAGLLDRDRPERPQVPVPQRSARAREDDTADLVPPPAAERLVDGAVLGVDGKDLRTRGPGRREEKLSGDDQGLLVGEREALSGGDRGVRRAEAHRAHERGDDEVRVRECRRLFETGGSRPDAAPETGGQEGAQAGDVLFPLDRDEVGLETRDLRREAVERAPGGERHDAESVRESGHDV